jgi:peptide/nickel transport system ATP-binding protein
VVEALRGVSFDVPAGSRFGLVGESGSGKSTLLRILCGLDAPTSGSVHVDGQRVDGRPERELGFLRRQLQVVFQDPRSALDPRMRVRDIVAEPLLGRPDVSARGAGARGARRGGTARRRSGPLPAPVLRRRAAAHRAGPRAGAPAVGAGGRRAGQRPGRVVRAQVLNLLADLVEQHALTLVFVSHDLSVVRRVCDTVAVLRAGEIVESGPVQQVHGDPQHEYTRRLVRAVPTLRGALAGVTAAQLAAGGAPAPPAGTPRGTGDRAHDRTGSAARPAQRPR